VCVCVCVCPGSPGVHDHVCVCVLKATAMQSFDADRDESVGRPVALNLVIPLCLLLSVFKCIFQLTHNI